MDQPVEQPPKNNSQEQARAAAVAVDQILADMRASYQSEVARINQIQDDGERLRARTLLDQQKAEEFRSKLSEQVRDAVDTGRTDSPEDKKIKAEKAKHVFLEAKALGDEGIKVGDAKSQQFVNKIVEYMKNGQISDEGALVLERNIGKDLLNGIVFSKPGEPPSTFEKNLKIAYEANSIATAPLLRDLGENQGIYGYEGTPKDLLEKIGISVTESQNTTERDSQNRHDKRLVITGDPEIDAEMEASGFGNDFGYYQARFTPEQLEIIQKFYSPTAFVEYMEVLAKGETADGKYKDVKRIQEIKDKKQKIEQDIKNYYEKNHKNFGQGEESLEGQVEKLWGVEISNKVSWEVSDVINQLFLELIQKPPTKFYEQIMQEDIFTGPSQIQHKIQNAINSLMTKFDRIEGGDTDLALRIKSLNLYRNTADNSYIEERLKEGDKEGDINKNIYPKINPLSFSEEVNMTEFINSITMTINQMISKTEYFHNSRAIYGQPPGEKGFYSQLGGFAEQMKGNEIDEIMMLPDGKYVLQAYQLYEKMLQEDFAQMDHRHRPDQLSGKLERVNSQIELEVIEQLKAFYPDLTDARIRNIVNAGVGISRGMTLTESEMSAYADPVDSEGKGMVASYSTNDDGSLNVFNPLHTVLRWQGEQFWNSMYFIPIHGQSGKPWDHKKAWNNMGKYMDSFLVGKGRGKGKDGLNEELFADSMIDIGQVGGPGKRKGWRMKYSLEGHFIYDKDGTINAPETFKAMEAIGYEAVYNFVQNDQAGKGLLKATETTDPVQAKERKKLFKYIFKRYFQEADQSSFQESEFNNYMAKLRVNGEGEALKQIKDNGSPSIANSSWEEQVTYETSQLFMKNMLAHYVAARIPTKFLRIDKNRLHDDGISHWQKVWRKFRDRENGWEREKFDKTMKNLTMAEMLLSRQISERIKENIKFDKKWTLNRINEIEDLAYRLDENKIRELLSTNGREDKTKNTKFKTEEDINDAIELFREIKKSYKEKDKNNNEFLDGEGRQRIKKFTFTFGLEDTDLSLMAFRNTGPRMVARAIKDVADIEQNVIPWIEKMPSILNEIAINGKHDFSPIIEYMRKAQMSINGVSGTEATYDYMYKMASVIINYFKKDAMAKPLFGLFRLGRKNSIAAEYAGRSTAVWEWDSRDIDRFAVSLESFGLLKNSPYDLQKFKNGKFIGGELEDRWIKIPGIKKPIKFNLFGKKRHIDYENNSLKLRKEHGADWKAITWDMVNQIVPLAMAFLLWKYIKDSIDEASGKKKQ